MIPAFRGKRDDLPSLTEWTGVPSIRPGPSTEVARLRNRICPLRLPDAIQAPIGRNDLVGVVPTNYRNINILDARYTNVVPDAIRTKRKGLSDQENRHARQQVPRIVCRILRYWCQGQSEFHRHCAGSGSIPFPRDQEV